MPLFVIGNMANKTDFRNGYNTNLDNIVDFRIKMVAIALGVIIILMNAISIIALGRTRHMPRTAKFLSQALLVFDFSSTLLSTVRKFVMDSKHNLIFQNLSMGFNFLAYIVILVMSIERLVVFHWPNFYLRVFKFNAFKTVCLVMWILYKLGWIVDFSLCYMFVDETRKESLLCFRHVIERHVMMIYWTSTVISCVCLIKISVTIVKQSNKTGGSRTAWQTHKSTLVVLICMANYILTSVVTAILTFLIARAADRRIAQDFVMILNAFVDNFAYVLWFKECRLELLKMLAHAFPACERRAEELRVEIFDIVTYNNMSFPGNVRDTCPSRPT